MKRIVIGIFVVMIFFGMLFIPSLGMSEDNTMEKWMQDHTVKVNVNTTCKYEQGHLLVKEVYTGEELKERFGIEQLTKELKMPVKAKVLVEGKLRGMQEGEEKVFVTEKVTVLTSGDDPPQWWYNYTYPQWAWSKSGDIYEKEDPINLAWKNTTKDTAKSEILEEGWYDWGTWYDFYVYDPVDGWKDDDNVADDPFGLFGRYHARLWQMSDGDVVANAHHDSPVPHEADKLEEAEELVAGYFAEPDDTEWRVCEDSYNLDNNVTSPHSDGWCTQINYGPVIGYIDDVANADVPVKGTVTGSYVDTHASENECESIEEVESKGKPASRYSYLEHKWTIDVTGDSDFVFHVEAYHTVNGEGDDFVFEYSKDDSTYTPIVTVTKTTDDNTYQTYTFTESITGTVYIRVKDTDRTAGNKVLDTISIDHMFIRSKSGSPSYGVTVTVDEASQQVKPGESTTYTVRVKNTGDFEASYSVVMSGTAVDETTITVSPLSWNTGTLAPNAEDIQTVTFSTTSSTPETTYTLTATATCEQNASVKDSATSELVVSSATNAMHVASIDMSLKTAGPNTNARALVTIVDATGTPVEGATVSGHWSGATTNTDSGTTDASGQVSLSSDKLKNAPSGTNFTFTVDGVAKNDWTYNSPANEETSDSITVQ